MSTFHVLIPAAGSGSRMGSELPKQYLPLLGKPLIHHVLAMLAQAPRIASVHVVVSADDACWDEHAVDYGNKVQVHRSGGATRAATVLNGLYAMAGQVRADDWILVHDAARPGLSQALLASLLDALEHDEVGGLLAIPLADTLKRADEQQRVATTEPRDGLWQAQTPQMFRYEILQRALQLAGGAPTDEAQAVEALGLKPRLVVGQLRNLKITYPQDLKIAEAILLADAKENEAI
ncbi:2-C-methyl-D-erythritol 4-phosphate cytidylyltransferase [Methylobacillus gramineus]|uniref:2-C-methyl-D-erythritol 4-phosphate cytidylyltransferase n=1 Tax=Methylobacillus gramineus TaxID=755169 RepID=UPI001CFFA29D|nr:2-C-methyl-D-erythritol 4-phosphate cytidylyltransferase [Methylobacillus gramineus]MCB5183964.1 2-C-methyl-D-erythritol 4-phosphate cytidylyltransferase [Methylobacillus gramineus]